MKKPLSPETMRKKEAQLKHAGEKIKNLRTGKKLSQKNVADGIGVSLRTYQKVESGEISTSFINVLAALEYLEACDIDFLNACGYDSPATSHDASDNHKLRLSQYCNESYSFYYVNPITEKPRRIKVKFYDITGYSYVYGEGTLDDETKYECKLISPPSGSYTYLYFTSVSTVVDRALFILPYNESDKVFGAGQGVMISISNQEPRSPVFQRFLVMNDVYGETDNEDDSYLQRELLIGGTITDYIVKFPKLGDESKWIASQHRMLKEHTEDTGI